MFYQVMPKYHVHSGPSFLRDRLSSRYTVAMTITQPVLSQFKNFLRSQLRIE